ncbi:MAG: YigZ family protein [Clostridiales bacterium]|nr:YigZ family protein [Clostridiales bacterium]
MLEFYKTILKEGQAEFVEKKSRFIATVCPVQSEEEARKFIDLMKKKYWDATHNVFAYQIGERNELQRFSDDGEPQGTAGLPVLDVLRGQDIKNVVIVVTRYFGGTLLGTGGLVRAYGRCAKLGLESAGIIEIGLYHKFSIRCDYSLSGKIQYEIARKNYILEKTNYTNEVEFLVYVLDKISKGFMTDMTEISNGQALITEEEQRYGWWDGNQFHPC